MGTDLRHRGCGALRSQSSPGSTVTAAPGISPGCVSPGDAELQLCPQTSVTPLSSAGDTWGQPPYPGMSQTSVTPLSSTGDTWGQPPHGAMSQISVTPLSGTGDTWGQPCYVPVPFPGHLSQQSASASPAAPPVWPGRAAFVTRPSQCVTAQRSLRVSWLPGTVPEDRVALHNPALAAQPLL